MSVNTNVIVKARRGRINLRKCFEAVVLFMLLWCLFVIIGRTLSKRAIAQIAELTNTEIRTESVIFRFNGAVFIKGLSIKPQDNGEYDNTILKATNVYARFGIGSLLLLKPRLKKISVHDFVLDAQQDLDTQRWNLMDFKLKAPKGGTGKLPLIRLKRGTLQYSRITKGQVKIIASIPIDAKFGTTEKIFGEIDDIETYQERLLVRPKDGYYFRIITAKEETIAKESVLIGSWSDGIITVSGGISSTDIPALEKVWKINVLAAELKYDVESNYQLKLSIRDLLSKDRLAGKTSEFDRSLPKQYGAFSALQRFFYQYQPRGNVDINLEASGSLNLLGSSILSGTVLCRDVSVCKRSFPYQIDHIVGEIGFTEKSISFNNLGGEHGDIKLSFSGWSRDFGVKWQYQTRITSENMALDDDLYNCLDAKWKKSWTAFSPSGRAKIDYNQSRLSRTDKKRTLAVELLGAEAEYSRLPYPLKNLTGRLFFEYGRVTVSDVISRYDNREITLNGQVTSSDTDIPVYNITIKANDIPMDTTLNEALPEGQQYFFNRFNLASQYGHGSFSMLGRIWLDEQTLQMQYRLSLFAKQLQLNDELFTLLPESAKKFVLQLNPSGHVNINANLNQLGPNSLPYDKITVYLLNNSIEYDKFPYPLKDIAGSITIDQNSITLNDIQACPVGSVQILPDLSALQLSGEIDLVENTFRNGAFAINASDILLDERLSIALPKDFRDLYRKLAPTGRFDLKDLNIELFKTTDDKQRFDFTGTVNLKNCNFKTAPAVTELNTQLEQFRGSYEADEGFSDIHAEITGGSLRIKEKALKELKTEIIYDKKLRTWATRDLTAQCYGGILSGKVELKQPAKEMMEYLVQAAFENIDLNEFLADSKRAKTSREGHSSGKLDGSFGISGIMDDKNSRIGRCRFSITDMQIGRLSPWAKILAVLKLTEPKDYAFDQMVVDSYIMQDDLRFDKIDLWGNSLAFNGVGRMGMQDQKLDVILTARGDRLVSAEASILESLTESFGLAIVRMEINGDLYEPQVKLTTLPVFKDALEILGTRPNANRY